jgi:hypothetical protein
MLQVRIHPASAQQVRWPIRSAEILALGQAVLAAEQALSPAQQCPQLPLLSPRVDALASFVDAADAAEAVRTEQADAERTAFETARALTRRIISVLTAKYANVALLEAWGVEVVGSGSRAHTRVPQKREAILRMLERYIAKENSLPAPDRLTTPALTEVTAARDALVAANTQRVEAIATRESAIYQRNDASQALLRLLQLIAIHHVTIDFGGEVHPDLQKLGFDLVARSHTRPPENGGSEPTTHS